MNLLVEGTVDDAVGRRLLRHVGIEPGTTFGRKGFHYIRNNVQAFARSARGVPLLVLADFMDANLPCPGAVVRQWLPHPEQDCVFRVAVREIESWLLADRVNLATLLGVAESRINSAPEQVPDPKAELIRLAQRGRRSARQAIAPAPGLASATGHLYNSTLAEFVANSWDPIAAAGRSPSLSMALVRLDELANRVPTP